MIYGVQVVHEDYEYRVSNDSMMQVADRLYCIVNHEEGFWKGTKEWEFKQEYLDATRIVMEQTNCYDESPNWIVCLDGDEQLSNPGFLRRLLQRVSKDFVSVGIPLVNLWDDRCRYRHLCNGEIDYRVHCWRPEKWHKMDKTMAPSHAPNGITSEGNTCHLLMTECAVIHYGYRDKAERERKIGETRALDPNAKAWGVDFDTWLSDKYVEPVPECLREMVRDVKIAPKKFECSRLLTV